MGNPILLLTEAEKQTLLNLHSYRPFVIWIAAKKQGHETQYWGRATMHKAKALLRDGWTVFRAGGEQ